MTFPDAPVLGTPNAGTTGATTYTLASHVADDVHFLATETNVTGGLSDPSGGWVDIVSSPRAQGSNVTALTAWWLRAVSGSTTNPQVPAAADHQVGIPIMVRGCQTSGDPWTASTSGGQATGTTGRSFAGFSTVDPDCLVLYFIACSADIGTDNASNFNSPTGLTGFTVLDQHNTTNGNGGSVIVAYGFRATAGAVGALTWDFGTTSAWSGIALAIPGASGTPATFTANAGDASADGGSTTFTGDALFSATVGDAAAAGGSASFTSDATFTTAVGDAAADGGSTTFTGAAVFGAAVGDAAADGGSVSFLAGGAVTFTATVGDVSAAGGTVSFTAGAVFTATVGDGPAAGGSSAFLAGAVFTATAGDAAAAGGSTAFTGSATFSTLVGDATADGGSTSFTGGSASTFTALAGDASADGGTASFVGAAAGTFSALAGDAAAAGGVASFVVVVETGFAGRILGASLRTLSASGTVRTLSASGLLRTFNAAGVLDVDEVAASLRTLNEIGAVR